MLSVDEYYKVLEKFNNEKALRDIKLCFPNEDEMTRIRELREDFGFDPNSGWEGLVEIYPLSEAKLALERPTFKVWNWQYDRITHHLIINLQKGRHEHLSSALWRLAHPEVGDRYIGIKETELNAEKFIEEGLGWFKSTASYGRALKGKNVKLTPQEKMVFGTVFEEI